MTIAHASLLVGIHAHQLGPADRGSQVFDLDDPPESRLTGGVGASQVDLLFSDKRTLASAASENLDLAGALPDAFGALITFAKVKSICIKCPATNTTSLTIGNAASNGFTGPFGGATHTLTIPPGGSVMLNAPVGGWAVTPGTGDILKVLNGSGAAADYSIDILGTSA
ncbi:MAG: hypothetical protein E6G97_25985 [Alphaproteobacteria bacterium]|nr:MAG: hypothetical protein E6G97_25985 [Alphaproteobacteria bacterium]